MAPPYCSGSCQCGAVSIAIDVQPFVLYRCHCRRCRQFCNQYRKPNDEKEYHSAGAVWKWNVRITGGPLEYEHTRAQYGLLSLARGRCAVCKDPVYEAGERCMFPFAMVAAAPVLELGSPEYDFFYDSGVQQQGRPTTSTTRRVLYSDLGSVLYEVYIIICVAIPLLPWSVWKRITRDSNSKGAQSKQA